MEPILLDEPSSPARLVPMVFAQPPPIEMLRRRLSPGVIHLWRFGPYPSVHRDEALHELLSDAEKHRVARYRLAADRHRFARTRALLRLLLASYLNCAPRAVRIEVSRSGKPRLAELRDSLKFNLSHAGELALIALTQNQELGVDIERCRKIFKLERLAQRYFSPAECSEVLRADSQDRQLAFLTRWTQLEARLKAEGVGLAARGQATVTNRLSVASFIPARDYVASIASTTRWEMLEAFDGRGFVAGFSRLP